MRTKAVAIRDADPSISSAGVTIAAMVATEASGVVAAPVISHLPLLCTGGAGFMTSQPLEGALSSVMNLRQSESWFRSHRLVGKWEASVATSFSKARSHATPGSFVVRACHFMLTWYGINFTGGVAITSF
jgi:hypothetical protein